MEDLRPVIVDAVVRRLVAQRRVNKEDFATSAEAGKTRVLLSDAGRRVFLAAYEQRMLTSTYDFSLERKATYRELLHERAQRLASGLASGNPTWYPIRWR